MSEIITIMFIFSGLFVGCGIAGAVMGTLERNEERIALFLVRSTFLMIRGILLALLNVPSLVSVKNRSIRTIFINQPQLNHQPLRLGRRNTFALSHKMSQ